MQILRRKKGRTGQLCCVNKHRSTVYEEAVRRAARDQVAPLSTLRYRA